MISVENLTQVYPSGNGVFDLTFTIGEGEVFGYLGPNGAGKTTTIRNLLGFTNRSSGLATINGLDCRTQAHEVHRLVGYVPGEIAFFENMTGTQFLSFIAGMRGMQGTGRGDELLARFQLDPTGKIKRMSKGMKQKLALVTAFMHDPPAYILDEPTSGLDPFMQNVFMALLREEKARGKTILMSSHIFEEVHRICDRAGILREGRLVAVEEISSLDAAKELSYVITIADPSDARRLEEHGLDVTRISDTRLSITVRQDYQRFFSALAECSVTGLESASRSLERVFMKYYGTEERS
jgi:ABC-2 type transport system ATP-binding protein